MVLKNSKAYTWLMVTVAIYAVFSLVIPVVNVVGNIIQYKLSPLDGMLGNYIFNWVVAFLGCLPAIILCIMCIGKRNYALKIVNALFVYFILNIIIAVLSKVVGAVFFMRVFNPWQIMMAIADVVLSALAIVGLNNIKTYGKTEFFKCVWLITIIYNAAVFIFNQVAFFVSAADLLFSYPDVMVGFIISAITGLASVGLFILFGVGVYIFINNITKEKSYDI